MSVHVGTSGWSYRSGKGTWNGVFYPATRSKRRGTAGFDELRFYAEHFDTVEVNTTFYGQPRAEVTAGWAARTPARFSFALKLYQKFTHPKMFREAALTSAPGSEGVLLDLLAEVTRSDVDDFRGGIEPIARAGKLGSLLAQFPPSFTSTPASRDYLARLLRLFGDYPVAVELRHRSWSDGVGDTLQLLNAFQAAWVHIDEPKFPFSIRQNALPNVTGFYYMRLHGRNAAAWWRHERAEDRYNYLYSAAELKEFSETAAAAKALVKKVYLYTNNHFAARSVVNAVMLKAQLGDPIEGEYLPEIVDRYPEIRDLVAKPWKSGRSGRSGKVDEVDEVQEVSLM
ncbi:MAG: hypothetical protein A3I61_04445 [Acidobacteria bacterium RIFCSPLOWO2_02_FULL_68_18]|nr:MAG: hypothetical protein A3I61_04445 [Acidobacteria bacterium RIFCSPLOWO2_02_FULL_68_18]OFW48410.1 MAG: hypothetical protein A3G77_13050 [Acidobacteria bacterium RIFCSPLOWO2_12_FULL_68_19]